MDHPPNWARCVSQAASESAVDAQTELAEIFTVHVGCELTGNSEAVAKNHYLQITEEHFARASNPTQQGAKSAREESQTQNASSTEDEASHGIATDCSQCAIV